MLMWNFHIISKGWMFRATWKEWCWKVVNIQNVDRWNNDIRRWNIHTRIQSKVPTTGHLSDDWLLSAVRCIIIGPNVSWNIGNICHGARHPSQRCEELHWKLCEKFGLYSAHWQKGEAAEVSIANAVLTLNMFMNWSSFPLVGATKGSLAQV